MTDKWWGKEKKEVIQYERRRALDRHKGCGVTKHIGGRSAKRMLFSRTELRRKSNKKRVVQVLDKCRRQRKQQKRILVSGTEEEQT